MKKLYIATAVVLFLGLFTWTSVRPYLTRRSCGRKAWDFAYQPDSLTYNKTAYDNTYTTCLHRRGL